jgi:hypothetical protein
MPGTEPHVRETGLMDTITYVGLDGHTATVCVALAESGRGGKLRQLGVFENRPELLMKLAAGLSKGGRRLSFCYDTPHPEGRQRKRDRCRFRLPRPTANRRARRQHRSVLHQPA